jgi:uncharacterized membrane protein YphA (DoxX/SURF4 family)
MFSIFPPLLSYTGFAPFLLRLTLGAVLGFWAYNTYKTDKKLAVLNGALGILLVLGLYTQLASLVTAILLGIRLFSKIKAKSFLTDGVNYYLILFVISICLIFTGAGYFAFDLPL